MDSMATINTTNKFKCVCCARCCRTKVVGITDKDLLRLVLAIKETRLPGTIFNYIIFRSDLVESPKVIGDKLSGAMTIKQKNGECTFLKNNKCSIWRYRPISCRLYPFNPQFIEHSNGYTLTIQVDSCPGIETDKKTTCSIYKTALLWRKERLAYDKIVAAWNSNKHGNLIDFVKHLLEAKNGGV